jgi:AAA domain
MTFGNRSLLHFGRIARRKLTLIAGDPGLGKSHIGLDVVARITSGKPWPEQDSNSAPLGSCIILSAEDAIDDVLRPRLEAAGADLTRVHALEGVRACDGEGNSRPTLFSLQYDLDLLGEQITEASQDLTSPKSGDAWGRSSRYWGDSFFGLPRLVIGKPSAILARLFA